jgi:hypothetical protein
MSNSELLAIAKGRIIDAIEAQFAIHAMEPEDWEEMSAAISKALADTRTQLDELRAALEFYADQFCEFGKHHEGCGKYDSDICAGCVARKALGSTNG